MSGAPADVAASPTLGFKSTRVQYLRRLIRRSRARAEHGEFVIEGPKLVAAALDAGVRVNELYVVRGLSDRAVDRARVAGARIFELAPGVMERVADTVSPQGLLAICPGTTLRIDQLRGHDLIVVCAGISDPGNLGTVLRSAGAAGIGAVICCKGTVDPHNPKCLRASAGSLFHQSVVAGGEPLEVLDELGSWGMNRVATVPSGGIPYSEWDLTQPTALVFGNEAQGLPVELQAQLDGQVTIPMARGAESLNVGAAAAVICFEAARQRRTSQ